MSFDEFVKIMSFYGEKNRILFNDKQLKSFYRYMNLLIEWNKKINLTAIIEPKEIIIKHFIDSLTINKYISKNTKLVDIGTGAGFPGIPLKIYRPDIQVTLVDSLNKRIKFLDTAIEELQLENINTIHSRVEDFGKNKKYRESFDYATARAVANLSILSEYLLPTVKVGGQCLCMKGSQIEEEIKNSEKAINILGGKINEIDNFYLPETDINRNVVIIDKILKNPTKHPRKDGMPSKEPLM